ncbi:hypothetical protein H6P81_002489 [Aristolochia fimbriata]|uniref:Uncharacterized protein n=1 Tax=Aristolochia fimbriata TaxID=158543 RepID=A0AAV7FDR2_ARIFI|nr:hypothetical protein H6P81_002489 [Aristolochia fimbriata]
MNGKGKRKKKRKRKRKTKRKKKRKTKRKTKTKMKMKMNNRKNKKKKEKKLMKTIRSIMALGKRPPPLPECSSLDIPEFGIEEKLYEKLDHKIPVEFDATSRRPKGKYNGEFIGYIGIAVRTCLPHQDRSAQNKVNISKLKVRHTARHKSFQRLFDEMGTDNSPINQFKQTDFSRKGAWGVGAEEKYNMIDQVREEHRHEIEKLKEENSRQLEEMRREMIQMMQGLRDP